MTTSPTRAVAPSPGASRLVRMLVRPFAAVAARLGRGAVLASRPVLLKEMLQIGHRAWFHAETFMIVLAVAAYASAILGAAFAGGLVGVQQLRGVGRELFAVLSVMTGVFAAWISLSAASGIILSEITGRRIALLRITSLSLGAVVVGKGLAVLARAAMGVVVMVPVWAALQLLGGVSQGDVLQAFALILGGMFVSTGIGLWASAGSRSGFGRVLRAAVGLGIWAALPLLFGALYFVVRLLTALSGLGGDVARPLERLVEMSMAFASPFIAWSTLVDGLMDARTAVIFLVLQAAGGLLFARRAARVLERNVIRAEELSSQPKVRDLASRRPRKEPAGRGLASRVRARLGAVLYRWKGTLVGCQVLQSNLVAIMLPVGLATGMFPSYLAMMLHDNPIQASDAAGVAAGQILFVLAAAVGIESCSLLAKEKSRRTAEILASTPAAGPGMVLWKGAALAVGQSVGAAGLVAIILVRQLHWSTQCFPTVLLVIFALPLFVFALGISFSLLSKSPMQAAVLMLLTLFLLSPLVQQFAVAARGFSRDYVYLSFAGHRLSSVALFLGLGLGLILTRNIFGALALPGLALGTALAMAALALFGHDAPSFPLLAGVAWIHESRMPEDAAAMLRQSALMVLVSFVLLAGIVFRFEERFLRGARAGE